MRFRLELLAGLLLLNLACGQNEKDAEKTTAQEMAATQSAQQALGELQSLANEKTYARLGFESLDEVANATLGTPFKMYFVGVEPLADYEENAQPASIMTEIDQKLYPVNVGDEARSSLSMVKKEDGWEPASFGTPSLIKLLAPTRVAHAETAGLATLDYFVVQIPALYLTFMGFRDSSDIKFIHVQDNPEFGFTAGATEDAKAVFAKLQPAAAAYESPLSDKQ